MTEEVEGLVMPRLTKMLLEVVKSEYLEYTVTVLELTSQVSSIPG